MAANPAYLVTLAQEILEHSRLSLEDNAITAPPRRFITFGEIADDMYQEACEQLAVRLVRIYTGLPGEELLNAELCGRPRTAEFMVRITRCVNNVDDSGRAPSDSELTGDAEEVLTDAWSLYHDLMARRGSGQFLATCQAVAFGNLIPHGPSGGVGGVEFSIDVQVLG